MKQLTRFELAAVKRTAANINGLVKKKTKLVEDVKAIVEKVKAIDAEIDMWDTPIKSKWGKSSVELLANGGVIEDAPVVDEEPQVVEPENVTPLNSIEN